MKVALVYDRVNKFGGAERVLLALHELWPDAPLYTSVYDDQVPWAKVFPYIKTSFLQNFPLARRNHELYPYLMPLAFESFDFDEFDLVISVTSEAAKGIITKPHTLHICYCLTPTRYLWNGYFHYKNSLNLGIFTPIVRFFYTFISTKLRLWDQIASRRPDYFITISQNVSERVKKYYRRNSKIIYPPVDTDLFKPSKGQTDGVYYLIVSRLVSYKNINIAIDAFNKLGLPLVIIGSGKEKNHLKHIAHKNIRFIDGDLTDHQLMEYYQKCKAVIFTADEDLGLVPLEAQACGKPVLAYKRGGALETVKDGITGEYFNYQTSESLAESILKISKKSYNTSVCRKNALNFNKAAFLSNFQNTIEKKLKEFKSL